MLAVAAFAAFTLTLDGHRIAAPQRALVVAGRTLLPLRSLGEGLGAVVDYRRAYRTIVVRRAGRTAELMIGNRRMLVAGVETAIEVAPRVLEGRAYVPVRAAALALGLDTSYDGATHTIALTSSSALAARPAPASSPVPHPAAMITRRYPQPDGRISDGYPAISALIAPQGGAPVAPTAVRLTVDGRDVSQFATIIGNEIVYTPPAALTNGSHAVHIEGVDSAGIPFASDWSFSTNYNVPLGAPSNVYGQGLTSVYVDRYLQTGERYFDVVAHGPPGGYGYVTIDYVSGSYQFFTQGIDRYVAHVTLPLGLDVPFAHAYVHFTDSTGNVVNYTLPSTLRLYTIPFFSTPAQATPVPHPTLDPSIVRRTIPTPSPAPAATAVPTRVPADPQPALSPSPPAHTRRPLGVRQPRIAPSASPRSSDPS
ncbi:MAG: hypothetical protein NVS2B17_00440 [Candidatus Velthaea sp.]